jgi:hypothetical protein
MDGCDIEIAEPHESLGPIMATAPNDRRVFAAYQAFSDAMEADDALTASAIRSSWLGELHMVFRASSAAKATQLRAKLEAYRALLRHAPEAAIVGPDDSSAYARTITRAVARGQVTTHGRDVRLDTAVSHDATEKAWFEQSNRSRAQRYAALSRVLTHALAGEAIPDDDAHALGGDALVAA